MLPETLLVPTNSYLAFMSGRRTTWQMSDEVGTNLVGAGQLVTCGDERHRLFQLGRQVRVFAARSGRGGGRLCWGRGCAAASSLAFGGVLSAVDVSDATLLSISDSS